MLTAFLKIVAAVAKYGSKAVKWANDHKKTIYRWLEAGMTASTIIDLIRQAVGA